MKTLIKLIQLRILSCCCRFSILLQLFNSLFILSFLYIIPKYLFKPYQISTLKDSNIFAHRLSINPFNLYALSKPLIATLSFNGCLIVNRLLVLHTPRKQQVHAMSFLSLLPENLIHVKFN
jgi:hypothetical protein